MVGADNTRKLATILAIDAVGYSADAERDQVGAAQGVAALRARVAELASKHGGRVFNTAGDGFMLEFPLASAAVRAAIALVEDAAKPDSGLPSVRAGAHLGEVMIEGADLMGHSVNVTARLVAQAEPNGLVISDALMSQIHGEIDAVFTPLGPIHLSKMRETVQAYAFVAGAAGDLSLRRRLTLVARRRWRVLTAGAGALIVAAAAALWLVTRTESYALDQIQMVANSRRGETQPTLSPDSRFIVYTVYTGPDGSNPDLFMRNLAGGEETPLTDTPDLNETTPAFSRTGDRLAFVRMIPPRLRTAATRCEIIVRVFPHGLDHKVGACEGARWTPRLSWTPDGRGLVYADSLPTGSPASRIRILDLDTGAVRDLVPPLESGVGDYDATVSPDGGRVAFVRGLSTEAVDVYVYDLRKRRLTRAADGGAGAHIAWADSRNLFVASVPTTDTARTELWLRPADGRGRGQLLWPAISLIQRLDAVPGLLAFQTDIRIENLWRSGPSGAGAVSSGNQIDFAADYARDGTLAYLSIQSSNWIYVQAPGAAQPRRLVELTGQIASGLRWSPDGRHMVYAAAQGEPRRFRLFIVDAASGVVRPVALAGDVEPHNPAWSPDGRSLVFTGISARGVRLLRVRLDANARPEPISDYGWAEAIETDRGLFAVRTRQSGIWRLAPGRAPEPVFPELTTDPRANRARNAWRDWTVVNGRLYVADIASSRTRILSRAVAGGAVTRVVDVEAAFTGSLAVDPRTGAVVYGVVIDDQSDIAVVRFHRR